MQFSKAQEEEIRRMATEETIENTQELVKTAERNRLQAVESWENLDSIIQDLRQEIEALKITGSQKYFDDRIIEVNQRIDAMYQQYQQLSALALDAIKRSEERMTEARIKDRNLLDADIGEAKLNGDMAMQLANTALNLGTAVSKLLAAKIELDREMKG